MAGEPSAPPWRDRSPWLWLTLAAYATGLVLLVLTPITHQLSALTVRLYVVWHYDLRLPGGLLPDDFGNALNVLLFVPAGVVLGLLTRRPWWQVALACALTSAAIETLQALPVFHRYSSLADLVSNSLGGLLGALIAAVLLRGRPVR